MPVKSCLLLLSILFSAAPLLAQTDAPKAKVYEPFEVQKLPEFPGGEAEMFNYIAQTIQYPEEAKNLNVQGYVVVSFIVEKNGGLTNIQVVKELPGGCNTEAVRVIISMPRWKPGEANGQAVRVKYTLPVRFESNYNQKR